MLRNLKGSRELYTWVTATSIAIPDVYAGLSPSGVRRGGILDTLGYSSEDAVRVLSREESLTLP